jgi:integrase
MDITELREVITKNRPALKDTTIKSYISILKSVYHQVYPEDTTIDVSKFNATKKFLDYLMNNFDPSVRKQYLSTLVVLTENDEYREQMMKDVATAQEEKSNNEMNKKQIQNHITNTEVNTLIQSLKNEVKLIYKNKSFTPENLITIQNYILICLFSGKYGIVPRRSMDYFMMKIKNVGNNDNWIDGNEFVFNSYKTVATYGTQRVKIPNILLKIIQKYIKVIPDAQDYLFYTITGKPLSAVTMNQRFNGLFLSKNISVNAFRHLYLSTHYANHITLKKDVANMGTSMNVLDAYIQKGNFR